MSVAQGNISEQQMLEWSEYFGPLYKEIKSGTWDVEGELQTLQNNNTRSWVHIADQFPVLIADNFRGSLRLHYKMQ
jgi:hypothetical protein